MKEVVWVFGTSASGKSTFINHIVDDRHPVLLDQFGWDSKPIALCIESLELIGEGKDPRRDEILDRVPELLESADIVLIKWQYVDSVAHRPEQLKDKITNARHWVIALKLGIDENIERLKTKSLWKNYGGERGLITDELPKVEQCLNDLEGFDIVFVDSGGSGNYEVIETG